MEKVKGFIKKINECLMAKSNNKRLTYLAWVSVLTVFCLILNISFGLWTSNYAGGGANITIDNLKYKMVINEVNLNSTVGALSNTSTIIGDRILLLKAGKTEEFNVILNSLNKVDTKYEIIYKVCTNVNCTSFIDTPSNINISYDADTPYVRGTLKAEKAQSITLYTSNKSDKDCYVLIDLNAGFTHNELAITNQINSSYSGNDVTIIAYVDGEEVTDFPTKSNYIITSECEVNGAIDSNVIVAGTWVSNHWKLTVDNVTKSKTVCNVTFTEITTPAGWTDAATGTLLAGIKANYSTPSNPLTTPGKAVSTSDEAVMAATEDDYGISYYFRGNVQNNYVVFANMCWRIVRITGDGSIKLVLYNYNSTDCTITGDDLAFARYSGTTYTTAFNTNNNDNAYVGFMYGTAGASTYEKTHENTNKSTILINLETWYKSNIASYESKLADTIWCNDKSTNSGTGIGTAVTKYGGANRTEKGTPSLICPDDNNEGKLSKFTVEDTTYGNGDLDYKIGLLTVDEIVFAGLMYKETNSNSNYLNENVSSSTYWWSLSPDILSSANGALAARVYDGSVTDYIKYGSTSYGLRPAISLLNSTTISGGNGTASAPFVIS